jgi:hypothetical protein
VVRPVAPFFFESLLRGPVFFNADRRG